jgi:hypothetical protein
LSPGFLVNAEIDGLIESLFVVESPISSLSCDTLVRNARAVSFLRLLFLSPLISAFQ